MSSPDNEKMTTEEEVIETEAHTIGCGILGKYPIISVVTFAAVGTGIGLGISYWEPSPDEEETKDIVIQWVGKCHGVRILTPLCV